MAGSPIMWRAIFLSASRAISTVSTAVAHLLVQRKKISVFRNDLVLALLDGLRALTSTTCCMLWVCAMLHWFCHHLWHRIRLGGLYAAAFCLSAHLLNTVLLGSGRTKRVYTNFEHQKFSGNFNNLESSKVRFYRDFFFFFNDGSPDNSDGTMQAAKKNNYGSYRSLSWKTAPARGQKMVRRFQFPQMDPR